MIVEQNIVVAEQEHLCVCVFSARGFPTGNAL